MVRICPNGVTIDVDQVLTPSSEHSGVVYVDNISSTDVESINVLKSSVVGKEERDSLVVYKGDGLRIRICHVEIFRHGNNFDAINEGIRAWGWIEGYVYKLLVLRNVDDKLFYQIR
ncbi:hypothetical protein PanWU01x14_277970 [Parasponia andersonii]|uniref:Uncharacterized protein n=1 Tax=Parasponia andersonii TaxID=3476 RepID=A0A2P5B2A1_PARAD|nr:hypothetical protein PanWU01x14_277970 [Parasponia andersonii]